MAVYFQGNEYEDFATVNNATTYATTYVNSYVRTGMRFACLSTASAETSSFSANDFWTHYFGLLVYNANTPAGGIVTFYSGSTAYLQIYHNDSTRYLEGRYWNGSSWVTCFTYANSQNTIAYAHDIYIKVGTAGTGEFKFYVNNQVAGYATGLDTTFGGAVSNFTKVRFDANYGLGGIFYVSEVIVADWPTLGARLVTTYPNAAGTYTEFAGGSYTAIDDTALTSDLLTSNTNGERMSAGFFDIAALGSGESIANVKVTSATSRDTSGPQNANIFARISGTDYNGSDQAVQLNIATTPRVIQDWATSPATSSAWTVTEINGAEFGIRSRT